MTAIICELFDLLALDEVYLEYDLIDAVGQVLLEYPDPRLERQMRDFEEFVNNMGINFNLYFELLAATRNHICASVRKILMASRIQRRYRRAMSDPWYKMCRDRLRREFGEMQ